MKKELYPNHHLKTVSSKQRGGEEGALLQKFLQADMIFFDQLKVSSVKFGKCFAEFMILIALLWELDG